MWGLIFLKYKYGTEKLLETRRLNFKCPTKWYCRMYNGSYVRVSKVFHRVAPLGDSHWNMHWLLNDSLYRGNPRVSIFLNTFYRFFLDFPQTYWVLRWRYREFALISNSHYLPLVDRVTEPIWINSERRMSWLDLLLHTSTYYYGDYMHRIMHWMVGVRDVRHVSIGSETFVVYPSNRMIFTTHTRK